VLDVGSSSGTHSGSSGGSPPSDTPDVPGPGGGTSGGTSSGGPSSGIVGGSGYFTVTSDVLGAGATSGYHSASVVFTSDFRTPDSTTIYLPCYIDPAYIEPANDHSGIVGAPRPQAGEVHVDGGNLALVFRAGPDGSYPEQSGQGPVAWQGGQTITISWPGPGGAQGLNKGRSHAFAAPVYASLALTSPFANPGGVLTLSRVKDVPVAWQTDTPPSADDRLVVELRVGPTGPYSIFKRARCPFDASAGVGVIPATVLEALGPGEGQYSVVTAHEFTEVIPENWHLSYSLLAHAGGARVGALDDPVTPTSLEEWPVRSRAARPRGRQPSARPSRI
jgi:hypothetical protein